MDTASQAIPRHAAARRLGMTSFVGVEFQSLAAAKNPAHLQRGATSSVGAALSVTTGVPAIN
jgi:hypothetical protein